MIPATSENLVSEVVNFALFCPTLSSGLPLKNFVNSQIPTITNNANGRIDINNCSITAAVLFEAGVCICVTA